MRNVNHAKKAAEYREIADEYESKADALQDLKDSVMDADNIGETALSALFHEVRTSKKEWKAATAFIDIEDGEAVVNHTEKLSEGHWNPETLERHEAAISISVTPFMDSDTFKAYARDNIQQIIDRYQQNMGQYRTKAETHSHLADNDAEDC